jgi:hypothetical protein
MASDEEEQDIFADVGVFSEDATSVVKRVLFVVGAVQNKVGDD